MILFITVIRALAIDRLPKQTFLVLWGTALLRLLVPFSAPFRFSFVFPAERGGYAAGPSAAVTTHNRELTAAAKQPAVTVQTVSGGVSPWTVLWLAGLSLAVLFFAAAYIRHIRRFRSAGAVENGFIRAGWRPTPWSGPSRSGRAPASPRR